MSYHASVRAFQAGMFLTANHVFRTSSRSPGFLLPHPLRLPENYNAHCFRIQKFAKKDLFESSPKKKEKVCKNEIIREYYLKSRVGSICQKKVLKIVARPKFSHGFFKMYTCRCSAIFKWILKNLCPPKNAVNIIFFQSKQHIQQYCHFLQQNHFEEVVIFENRGTNSRTPGLVKMTDKSDNVIQLKSLNYASQLKIEVEWYAAMRTWIQKKTQNCSFFLTLSPVQCHEERTDCQISENYLQFFSFCNPHVIIRNFFKS